MCLILVAWRVHPDFPLVLAANRDEFYARAAQSAAWWPDPSIFAGRDLSAGGTWLGVARDGRFAALTNYRDPTRVKNSARSRGELVPACLSATDSAAAQLERLRHEASQYNDFNLLFSQGEQLAIYESVPARGRLLDPGIYGLSNHLLDTPWPKVQQAKSALGEALRQLPRDEGLLALLRQDVRANDAQLPHTGVSIEWERLLSSAFIQAPGYGTRCSSVLLLDRHGEMHCQEWTWDQDGALAGLVDQRFNVAASAPNDA